MKVGFVAVHYPDSRHLDELIARVKRAVEVMRLTPGCLSADCWVTVDGDAVVSTGQWESDQARTASFATARDAGVDFTYDERDRRPRQIFRLRSP
jgi:quinol monooxygenase YgiN